jgi:hypothetical protein
LEIFIFRVQKNNNFEIVFITKWLLFRFVLSAFVVGCSSIFGHTSTLKSSREQTVGRGI